MKTKFGSGYRISIITNQSEAPAVKEDVARLVPGSILEDDSAGALIYQCPPTAMPYIPNFVSWIEQNTEKRIKNWGISQSTLEEVFLKLIRSVNPTFQNKTITR